MRQPAKRAKTVIIFNLPLTAVKKTVLTKVLNFGYNALCKDRWLSIPRIPIRVFPSVTQVCLEAARLLSSDTVHMPNRA